MENENGGLEELQDSRSEEESLLLLIRSSNNSHVPDGFVVGVNEQQFHVHRGNGSALT